MRILAAVFFVLLVHTCEASSAADPGQQLQQLKLSLSNIWNTTKNAGLLFFGTLTKEAIRLGEQTVQNILMKVDSIFGKRDADDQNSSLLLLSVVQKAVSQRVQDLKKVFFNILSVFQQLRLRVHSPNFFQMSLPDVLGHFDTAVESQNKAALRTTKNIISDIISQGGEYFKKAAVARAVGNLMYNKLRILNQFIEKLGALLKEEATKVWIIYKATPIHNRNDVVRVRNAIFTISGETTQAVRRLMSRFITDALMNTAD